MPSGLALSVIVQKTTYQPITIISVVERVTYLKSDHDILSLTFVLYVPLTKLRLLQDN